MSAIAKKEVIWTLDAEVIELIDGEEALTTLMSIGRAYARTC